MYNPAKNRRLNFPLEKFFIPFLCLTLFSLLIIFIPTAGQCAWDNDNPATAARDFVADTWTDVPKLLTGNFLSGGLSDTVALKQRKSDSNWQTNQPVYPGKWKYKFIARMTDTVVEKYNLKNKNVSEQEWETFRHLKNMGTYNDLRNLHIPPNTGDTIVVWDNWSETPPVPTELLVNPAGCSVKLEWAIETAGGLDVILGGSYDVFYDTVTKDYEGYVPENYAEEWVQANKKPIRHQHYKVSGLTPDTFYTFIIRARDAYGLKSDVSKSDTAKVIGKIMVHFLVDMRREAAAGQAPKYGVYLAGNRKPLDWEPHRHPMNQVSPGIWSKTVEMLGGQKLEYQYVKDAGTMQEFWESEAPGKTLFRIYPPDFGLPKDANIYVRGNFNGWTNKEEWKLKLNKGDSVQRLRKKLTSAADFKFYSPQHPDGWFPGGGNLHVDLPGIPSYIHYQSSEAETIYVTGDFYPVDENQWASGNPRQHEIDPFYRMTEVRPDEFQLVRYFPKGDWEINFIVNKGDGLEWITGSNRQLLITGNRRVDIVSNVAADTKMKLTDIWGEASGVPPRTPLSYTLTARSGTTAGSDSGVADINWKKPLDIRVTGYAVYHSAGSTEPTDFNLIQTIDDPTVTSFQTSGYDTGKNHYFKIAALDQTRGTASPFTLLQKARFKSDTDISISPITPTGNRTVKVIFPDSSLPDTAEVLVSSIQDLHQLEKEPNNTKIKKLMEKFREANKTEEVIPAQFMLAETEESETQTYVFKLDVTYENGKDYQNADNPFQVKFNIKTNKLKESPNFDPYRDKAMLYVLNEETSRWTEVSGSAYKHRPKHTSTVQGWRKMASLFQIMGVKSGPDDLDEMVVYPNPVYPNRDFKHSGKLESGGAGATFFKLPDDFKQLRIYDISGQLVRVIDQHDPAYYKGAGHNYAQWNLRNDHNQKVASGTYIWFAESKNDKRTGKVAVLW